MSLIFFRLNLRGNRKDAKQFNKHRTSTMQRCRCSMPTEYRGHESSLFNEARINVDQIQDATRALQRDLDYGYSFLRFTAGS